MAQHIGIVGCSAPGAALCYETICMEGVGLAGENQAGPEVSLHTHPFSEYMRRIKAGDWQAVAELMLSSAEKLAGIGAEFIVAPCNTIHYAFESVAARSPLPWLHIAEAVAVEANRLGYRRVVLLGTKLMMEAPIYPSKFAHAGIELLIPEEPERDRINHFIFEEMVFGNFTPEARRYCLGVVERLRNQGCDAVGLCCTELPLLFRGEDVSLPLLDSTRILARAALRRAVGKNQ
jgi:aspartate racemase